MFEKFIDDAAVFPPGLAELTDAVTDHLANSAGSAAPYVGPLVLPLDQVMTASQIAADRPIMISVVVPAACLPTVAGLLPHLPPTTIIVAVELKIDAADADLQIEDAARFAARHRIVVWAELHADMVNDGRLIRMRENGVALKFRTGGVTPEVYPTAGELLTVLSAAVRVGIRFKLTAGLHRALRYTEAGEHGRIDHFGFLNIAAAVAALRAGDAAGAIGVLHSDDGAELVAAIGQDPNWRNNFISFGCCSIVEPLSTLADVGAVADEVLAGVVTRPDDTTDRKESNR
ncbi:hypothetical protein GCM10027289_03480 [Tsukamurella serpentis]